MSTGPPPPPPPPTWVNHAGQPCRFNGQQWVPYGGPIDIPPAVYPHTGGPNDVMRTPQASSSKVTLDSLGGVPIDPALVALPSADAYETARLKGGSPAPTPKTAGSRHAAKTDRKGKGKARADVPSKRKRKAVEEEEEDEPAPKRGRSKGAANYRDDEVNVLLDLVEDILPTGGKGWKVVGDRHRDWAQTQGSSERTDKSLESKFKQLVKTSKPTGNAVCPPAVEHAHEIDALIDEKVSTRELDDADIVDIPDNSDTDSGYDSTPDPPKRPKVGPVARAVKVEQQLPSALRGAGRPPKALDILGRLTDGLNPSVQAARDDERALRSIQSTQIMMLNTQIRDLNNITADLRRQLMETERRFQEESRRADRIQHELSMTIALQDVSRPGRTHSRRRSRPRPPSPDRWEVTYADGGHATFFGQPDSFDNYFDRPNPSPRQYHQIDSPEDRRSRLHRSRREALRNGNPPRLARTRRRTAYRSPTPVFRVPPVNSDSTARAHADNGNTYDELPDAAPSSSPVLQLAVTPSRRGGFAVVITPSQAQTGAAEAVGETEQVISDWELTPSPK
ncbi:hypothetical protein FA95DRAFT_1662927 [Auriscalpium vulgare]|uniref:Uncharacterized protein n=1 Tax=Auriscalpium vulgare TaxID=40419 RepID=A0ACB8RTH9_9AGAM|nr:hypothetical protein FA95DRAFT_1662927 [Auriscalpium vulgare]